MLAFQTRPWLRSAASFVLVYAIAEGAVRGMAAAGVLQWLQTGTANAAAGLLAMTGDVSVNGCVITAGASTVNVSGYCIPSSAIALTLALMLATVPTRLTRRFAWAAVGVLAVLLVNVFRVAVVGWLAWTESPALDAIHTDILPILLALTGVGVWWLALGRERRHE